MDLPAQECSAAEHLRLLLLLGLCPVQRALALSESLFTFAFFFSSCRIQPRGVGHPGPHLGGKLLYPLSFSLHLCGIGSFALNAGKTSRGVCHGLLIFGQDFHCFIQRFSLFHPRRSFFHPTHSRVRPARFSVGQVLVQRLNLVFGRSKSSRER